MFLWPIAANDVAEGNAMGHQGMMSVPVAVSLSAHHGAAGPGVVGEVMGKLRADVRALEQEVAALRGRLAQALKHA
jgi:uncharacterized protein YceH (UPF0502 family)